MKIYAILITLAIAGSASSAAVSSCISPCLLCAAGTPTTCTYAKNGTIDGTSGTATFTKFPAGDQENCLLASTTGSLCRLCMPGYALRSAVSGKTIKTGTKVDTCIVHAADMKARTGYDKCVESAYFQDNADDSVYWWCKACKGDFYDKTANATTVFNASTQVFCGETVTANTVANCEAYATAANCAVCKTGFALTSATNCQAWAGDLNGCANSSSTTDCDGWCYDGYDATAPKKCTKAATPAFAKLAGVFAVVALFFANF